MKMIVFTVVLVAAQAFANQAKASALDDFQAYITATLNQPEEFRNVFACAYGNSSAKTIFLTTMSTLPYQQLMKPALKEIEKTTVTQDCAAEITAARKVGVEESLIQNAVSNGVYLGYQAAVEHQKNN